jgi:hypothetical protein
MLLLATPSYAQPNKEAYELSERCGKQAAATHAHDWPNPTGEQRSARYENHYSRKFNKCFYIEIVGGVDKGKWTTTMRLYDLHENKELGGFYHSDTLPEYTWCYVKETGCKSEAEWRQLIKQYMED